MNAIAGTPECSYDRIDRFWQHFHCGQAAVDGVGHAFPHKGYALEDASYIGDAGHGSVGFKDAETMDGVGGVFSEHVAAQMQDFERYGIAFLGAFDDEWG